MRRYARAWPVVAAGLVLSAHGAGAQGKACDERAGTLGIQGMACEGCSFRMGRSGLEQAQFRTEPEVVVVARGFTRGDRLRAGDRIIAVDGFLITTKEGSQRLVDLRAAQPATVRVRRDGEIVDLSLVPGSACELRRRAERDELELERADLEDVEMLALPPSPPKRPPAAPAPDLPGQATLPALPPLPTMPAPPTLGPAGYLGFGLSCSRCGAKDGVLYFSTPPVLQGVSAGGPAQRAGLRSGDEILEVDGADITTPEGGRRFGAIEPGERVSLTIRRGGERRAVTLVAAEHPAGAPGAPSPPPADRLRYEGELGDVRIEVRGAPVRVTVDEETGAIVIRTSDSVIHLRRDG